MQFCVNAAIGENDDKVAATKLRQIVCEQKARVRQAHCVGTESAELDGEIMCYRARGTNTEGDDALRSNDGVDGIFKALWSNAARETLQTFHVQVDRCPECRRSAAPHSVERAGQSVRRRQVSPHLLCQG